MCLPHPQSTSNIQAPSGLLGSWIGLWVHKWPRGNIQKPQRAIPKFSQIEGIPVGTIFWWGLGGGGKLAYPKTSPGYHTIHLGHGKTPNHLMENYSQAKPCFPGFYFWFLTWPWDLDRGLGPIKKPCFPPPEARMMVVNYTPSTQRTHGNPRTPCKHCLRSSLANITLT